MTALKVPLSLRLPRIQASAERRQVERIFVARAACVLAAAGSSTSAEAQQAQAPLPPVTIDAPAAKKKPVTTSPSPAQKRAKAALRRRTKELQHQQAAPVVGPASTLPVFAQRADANPYAMPGVPYKIDHLSSNKFPEAIANTPRSITVYSKEILQDKNATTLQEIARNTAGVTLGTGEGGNAFGDRFFIRGYDARNDIFVDGVRDPAMSIRENFFTEQVEILRGPASSFAGRGTAGGAINIVTKQAGDRDFYNAEGEGGFNDQRKRVTIDMNKAISPILAVRVVGLYQDSNVAGRDYAVDDRNGVAGAIKFTPTPDLKFTANYNHTYLSGLPDFGVPYYGSTTSTVPGSNPAITAATPTPGQTNRPVTEGIVPRTTYYGFVNRDFTKTTQNIGTLTGEYRANDYVTFNTKFRQDYSILNYVGTIPESIAIANGSIPGLPAGTLQTTLNPQSRFQTANTLANQSDATIKFTTGQVKNTVIVGTEFSRERVSIGSYSGLSSEVFGTGSNAAGSTPASVYFPPNLLSGFHTPLISPAHTVIPVDTKSVYMIENSNWNDLVFLNGGVRYDNYNITATNYATTGAINKTGLDSGMVNYNVGLLVKPLPYAGVYAAYATSSEPVGAELDGTSVTYGGLSGTATVNQVFSPQEAKAIEVGTKWELFDKKLLVTGSLFRTEVTNARETATINGIAGTVVAGAAYTVQGIDLEAAGKITDKWSVFGGLVLMDPKVTHSIIPTNVGLPLANVANRSFNILSKYQVLDWLELGGQATYRSQILGGTLLAANGGSASNQPTVLPSYWSFDTFLETKIGPNLEARLYASNIFNRTFYDAFYQSSRPFTIVAPGRAVTMIVSAKF